VFFKHIRTIGIATIVAMVALMVIGCGFMPNSNMSEEEYAKNIQDLLYKQRTFGLPGEEEVLAHLKEKYGKEFIYFGNMGMTGIAGVVYAAPADNPDEIFELHLMDDNGKHVMWDGYQMILAQHQMLPEITAIVKKYLPEATDIVWLIESNMASGEVLNTDWAGGDVTELLQLHEDRGAFTSLRMHLEKRDPENIKIAFDSIMRELNKRQLVSWWDNIMLILPDDIPTDTLTFDSETGEPVTSVLERARRGTTGSLGYPSGDFGVAWYESQHEGSMRIKYHGFEE